MMGAVSGWIAIVIATAAMNANSVNATFSSRNSSTCIVSSSVGSSSTGSPSCVSSGSPSTSVSPAAPSMIAAFP